MRKITWAAGVAVTVCLAGWSVANAREPVPLYCLDSTGVAQPMKYANTGSLWHGFEQQFHWRPFLTRLTETKGRLVFSRDGTMKVPEWIAYDVEQHDDGLMLRVMHVHFPQKIEDVTGNEMCIKTQMIAMGQ